MSKEEIRRKFKDERNQRNKMPKKKKKKKKNIGLSRGDLDFLTKNTKFNEKAIQDWYR